MLHPENFGILEQQQTHWVIVLNVGLRFALVALAAIAVYTGLSEVYTRLTSNTDKRRYFTEHTYALFFANRVLIGIAVLCYTPSAFYRLGVRQDTWFEPHSIFYLQMVAHVCMIAYFLMSETLRLTFTGKLTLREAINQSWLFVIAAVILGLTGVYSVWY